MRPIRLGPILLAGIAYILVGTATAAFAGMASSPSGVKGWRLVAWLLSLAVFSFHFVVERRRATRGVSLAVAVALGVAIGALGVAALGPVRSHWGDKSRLKLALLSLVAWPLLTGIPAFLVALTGSFVLDRLTTGAGSSEAILPNER